MEEEQAVETRKSTDMERIVKIETIVQQVTTEQTRLSLRQDKQEELFAKMVEQQYATNLLTAAIHERTDMHSKEIENLQRQQNETKKEQMDIGSMLASMKTQLGFFRNVAYIFGSLIAAYIFSHFIK